jgi:tRNA(Ile2) C34 agmatinyltransferase TiaS
MFLVPLILQMFGKKQVKVNFSREEVAQHVRAGALKIVCNECACRMMPNEADWIECTGCGKAMAAGDHTEVLREIRPRKAL